MKKILFVLMACVLCIGLVGGAFAYFSDTETSSGNTFTAGTLDLVLSNDGSSYTDGVVATWVSPTNWAPGDPEVIAELRMQNSGTIGVKLVGVKAQSLSETPGSDMTDNIADNIIVTTIKYTEGGSYLYGNLISYYGPIMDGGPGGNGDGVLTLREFVNSPYNMLFWIGNPPDDARPDYLPAGNAGTEKVELGFTLPSTAENDCQGDQAGFELLITAYQSFNDVNISGWGP